MASSPITDPRISVNAPRPVRRILGFPWPAYTTVGERSSLIAGGLGWMLDAMDVMLYSMVLANLLDALHMSKQTGGLLIGLTLGASAIGGVFFGFVADRIGRTRALMISILVYSLASGASGFSTTVVELAIFRLILGLGMGGEVVHRCGVDRGDVACRASRQSAWADAIHLGHRRNACRGSGCGDPAAIRLASCVFCRRLACCDLLLDFAQSAGIRNLARASHRRGFK